MSFRENQATVIHCDTDILRATSGLQELFTRPAVVSSQHETSLSGKCNLNDQTLRACYAVPRAGSSRLGEPSRQPAAAPDAGDVPMTDAEKSTGGAGEKAWIVGDELEKVMSEEGWEERYDLKWPFRYTKAHDDWEGREFVL